MAAIKAGADGYLLKSVEPDALCQAMQQVAAGQSVLSPEITAKVMRVAARYGISRIIRCDSATPHSK